MRLRRCTVVATAAVLMFVAAGCGGGGDDGGGVASLSGKSANGTTETTAKAKDPAEAARDFARCMREHGVDMPDPKVSAHGLVQMGAPPGEGADEGPDNPKFRTAEKACQPLLEAARPNGGQRPDPEQEARMRRQALAFAKCMREHGVDMPDPQFEGGGKVTQQLPRGSLDDAAFRAANKACMKDAGMKGGFVIGGPVGSSK
jgi:hypothetical protein